MSELWTIEKVLGWTVKAFQERGLESPRLDAELLLAHVLGCERIRLYTHFDQPLTEAERSRFRELVKRRSTHEPVAYLLGTREFFGRELAVSPAVLVPRPETEHIVEAVLAWPRARERGLRILDVGTGSGNLAVTLACELPESSVVAVDLSPAALEIAGRNALTHGVGARLRLVAGDLFAPVAGEVFDVVVSNPPYVESGARESLMPDVRDYEPAMALFAGPEGTEILERLRAGLEPHLATPGLFVCETGAGQAEGLRQRFAERSWLRLEVYRDLQGHGRGVIAER